MKFCLRRVRRVQLVIRHAIAFAEDWAPAFRDQDRSAEAVEIEIWLQISANFGLDRPVNSSGRVGIDQRRARARPKNAQENCHANDCLHENSFTSGQSLNSRRRLVSYRCLPLPTALG